MPEIGTSGSMSGDGKRGVGRMAPSYRAHPRLYLLRPKLEGSNLTEPDVSNALGISVPDPELTLAVPT